MRVVLLTTGALLLSAGGWLLGPPWPLKVSLELVERPQVVVANRTITTHTLALPRGQPQATLPLPAGAVLTAVRTHVDTAQPHGLVLSSGAREGRWGVVEAVAAGGATGPEDWAVSAAYRPQAGDHVLIRALHPALGFAGGTVQITLELEE